MIGIELSKEFKTIPSLIAEFKINYQGVILCDNKEITLDKFNTITKLNVLDLDTLRLITFHHFNWPPKYWHKLTSLGLMSNENSVENMVIGLRETVPSLEYDEFYMIPYFSNYVISECGKLIKRSTGDIIQASKAATGYYTFKMTSDSGKTANYLRHRILAMAFIRYPADFEDLDINHKNGIRGSDDLSNLEWCTRSENMNHAYDNELRNDNVEVQAYDNVSDQAYIFRSYNQAARFFGISTWSVINSAKSLGYKSMNGIQFRNHPCHEDWPIMESRGGDFEVQFPDGSTKVCTTAEAARYCNVTKTSLQRLLREGRNQGQNENTVRRIVSPTT